MGSIIKFQLLNDRFTFQELKNDEKIYVDIFVSLLLHIYIRHLSPPVRKICHIFFISKIITHEIRLGHINLNFRFSS